MYVALLRGINVGGNNLVSMAALKASFERLGVTDVKTYINSGNVLFRAANADVRELQDRIGAMLAREHGLAGRTVVRTRPEMARLVRTMTKAWKPDPAWRYNVIFLRDGADAKRALAAVELDPELERVIHCSGAVLWSARVSSLTRTAMVKLSRMPIYKEMTVRNANTARKILELMEQMAGGTP